VFGEAGATDVVAQGASWERIKAEERGAGGDDAALAGVARSLPALSRAAKLGKRAGRVGFDWPDAAGVRDKVAEELAELDEVLAGAVADPLSARRAEELGDLLFAVANWGRHLGIDPEEALRAANRKFERRFAAVEAAARARHTPLETLTAQEWDALWVEAKRGG
jgi:ATP diphosphatase